MKFLSQQFYLADSIYFDVFGQKLLNRDFLVMVMIAIIIGIPVTWYLASSWLENFVYRIEIKWWIMLLTGTGFLMVSLLTVTYQSWRAASRNPLDILRHE